MYVREKSGGIWREDRAEQLGNYQADFYTVNGMVLESRKRREYLSEEDLQKKRAIIDSFSKGKTQARETSEPVEPNRRESMVPPPNSGVLWAEYSACPPGHWTTTSTKQENCF